MHRRSLSRAVLYILALSFVWSMPLVAQKLHNETRDKLAQQIKSDFEQLTSPDGNIFEQAIKNAEAINDADIQQWRAREHTLMDSVATVLPFMTWEELQELAFTSRNQILDVSKDVQDKTKVSLDGLKTELAKVKSEEEGIQKELEPFEKADPLPTVKQIEDAVKKTIEDGSPLNVNLKTLPGKISTLPDDFSNLKKIVESLQAPQGLNKLILQTKLLMLQNEQARLELRQAHFKERQAKLADFEDHVAKYAGGSAQAQKKQSLLQSIQDDKNELQRLENQLNNPDPNSKKTPTELQELQKKKVAAEALLKIDSEDLDQVLKDEKPLNDELELERTVKDKKTPNAITSCEELRKACADNTRNQVIDENTRHQLIQDAFGSFWQVVGEICKEKSYLPGDTITKALKELAETAPAAADTKADELCPVKKPGDEEGKPPKPPAKPQEQRLVRVLNKLNDVVDFLAVRYDLFVEQTNLSHDELIFHIRMMRLNAQEHEVLMHSGITGLATYEAGGIKPEDVANIIHTAQTLATAAIAARVK